MGKKSISLIIPVYNEEKIIENTIKVIYRILKRTKREFELIIANDGSTDLTFNVVKDKMKSYKELGIIGIKKHVGKGAILTKAFKVANKDIQIYMDAAVLIV